MDARHRAARLATGEFVARGIPCRDVAEIDRPFPQNTLVAEPDALKGQCALERLGGQRRVVGRFTLGLEVTGHRLHAVDNGRQDVQDLLDRPLHAR